MILEPEFVDTTDDESPPPSREAELRRRLGDGHGPGGAGRPLRREQLMSTQTRPAFMDAVTVLRRNRTGDVYHLADCPRVKVSTSVPWSWAEGKTRGEIMDTAVNGLMPCKVCKPLDHIPTVAASPFDRRGDTI